LMSSPRRNGELNVPGSKQRSNNERERVAPTRLTTC
jgi:hypothetical protein